jgi:hypothetical protein
VLDYNKNLDGVGLKVKLQVAYLMEPAFMNKWYMEMFCRLLYIAVLNTVKICRQNIENQVDRFAFRMQLVEGLFIL